MPAFIFRDGIAALDRTGKNLLFWFFSMGQGPVLVVFILMLPGASVQPGGGALERADYRKTDHKTTGPPSQRAKRALTLTRESVKLWFDPFSGPPNMSSRTKPAAIDTLQTMDFLVRDFASS